MLLGSYSAMSAWTQESVDKLLALNKNKRCKVRDESFSPPTGKAELKDHTGKVVPRMIIYHLDVSDEDLSDLDLSRIYFSFFNFYQAKLNRSDLSMIGTYQSDFRSIAFWETNLNGAKFEEKSPLDNSWFMDAKILEATLEINPHVRITHTDKTHAQLITVELFEIIREKENRAEYILDGSGIDTWPYDAR